MKDRARNGASKEGRGVQRLHLPPLSFFGSRFISRTAKTENPIPRVFFAAKLNGNACYAG